MGLFKRKRRTITESSARDASRKKSLFDMFSQTNRVSEATLQVWRNLPGEIRHDPSMVCFQREAERWKGEKKHAPNFPPTGGINFTSFQVDII